MNYPLLEELKIALLFWSIYVSDKLFGQALGVSPIIGQILIGMVLGPAVLDIVPFVDAFRVLGKMAIVLVVIESGLAVDIVQVKKLGVRAILAASAGVFVPVLLTMVVLSGGYGEHWKTSLAAGAALAPTSLGFSAQLLNEKNQLHTVAGQLICTAAVIDDVLSLLLLAEVKALQNIENPWNWIAPIVASIGSIVIGTLLTLYASSYVQCIHEWNISKQNRERCSILLLLLVSMSFAWLSSLAGSSDLLGAFFGGLLFSTDDTILKLWQKHMAPFVRWGGAFFFAATIAFGIPSLTSSGGLFQPQAILQGLLLTAVAILGKFAVGPFSIPFTWNGFLQFSFAMCGRGEFSFLIADEAVRDGLLDPIHYSAIVWALLLSSFTSPFGFRHYLQKSEPEDPIYSTTVSLPA